MVEVLKEAQCLGYAEADLTSTSKALTPPTKPPSWSAIAFGILMQLDKAYVEGITKLEADIAYAEQLGYRIKLLGIAKRRDSNGISGTELRCTRPRSRPNASTSKVQ